MSAEGINDERRRRLVWLGGGAALLVTAAVAALIVIGQSQTSGGDTDLGGVQRVERDLAGIPQRGMTLGDATATVTVIEFADLQCPACQWYSEEVLRQVIRSKVRSGEAMLEFHNYPALGEDSTAAAAAALAAGAQGRGWNFVELFYRNQGFENFEYVTDSFLKAIAEAAGVADIRQWNTDRRSPRVLAQLARESEQAENRGGGGAPFFEIKGPGTAGEQPIGQPSSAESMETSVERAAIPE